jgi:chromosome partitioning protein
MPAIALLNLKGGVGKSTTAVHFAIWLHNQGKSVAFIDADPQQTSSTWLKSLDIGFPVQALLDPEELFERVNSWIAVSNYVLIDGPGSLSEQTKTILDCSDLALIPCQPSGPDIQSSGKILQIIKHKQLTRQGKPKALLFLNRAMRGTVLLRDSEQALSKNPQFPLLKTVIHQRQLLADANIQHGTAFSLSGKAAKDTASEYEQLFGEVLKQYTP